MKQVDMSEKAILRRLRQVDELREACLTLMKAKRLHDEKSGKDNNKPNRTDKAPKSVK